MTGPAVPGVLASGLLGKLVAAVRPEFRADVLVFDPADPVFGRGVCLVEGCGWRVHGGGLCQGHRGRWHAAGRPDLAADGPPAAMTAPWNGHGPLPSGRCRVAGCGFGVSEQGLCAGHASAWKRAGLGPWPVGRRAAGRGDAQGPARVPDQLLRPVGSAGIGAVQDPRQALEGSRPARPGGVRPVLRGAPPPGASGRARRPGIAAPPAEAGTAVRPAAAARRQHGHDPSRRHPGRRQGARRQRRHLLAGAGRAGMAQPAPALGRQGRAAGRAAGLRAPPGHRPGRGTSRMGHRVPPRHLAAA